ncbi:hypothetical protein H8356DRAFT_1434583 [Neocallimastix lanati (nom. inval.)]|jgi:hypothetical protein|uniref:Uncharacterized protein n=1 Tax=Neocallimastix californiae TaxID=1754190 RepID=A0A1Y1YZI3_9FUNG|nr:hypothetical protein H8356DRAFT_1434583 [Neocallimastix sp. JGI-2020a]ORY03463.1 hypothetical protein LY90DRAFT_215840 [Neocallimastix californiae]|eukprot:ORY03463.1 hypothetical protein LY90DRAFT_215840 [Neocallimastix californiae]
MSTNKSLDARRPDAVVKFVPPEFDEDNADIDWIGFIALIIGIFGLFKKNKFASWISLFMAISSVITGKKSEAEARNGGSLFFAISSLIVVYTNEVYFSRLAEMANN